MPRKVGKKIAKSIRKEQRQEELREKLKGDYYIRQIDKCVEEILSADYVIPSDELQARKLVIETNFKRLAKILPDLKAVEMSGNITMQTHEEWLQSLS